VSGFDRAALTRDASLNQVRIRSGPFAGRHGADLLSRDAVAALAPDLRPTRFSDDLAGDPRADEVADEIGRRVACLVTALRQGPPADEPAARRRALAEWTAIDRVALGGGLLAGPIGPVVVNAAVRQLAASDAPPTSLDLAAHAPHLGLIGAARTACRTDGDHLVLDAGHSTIKRAMVVVRDGELRRLELLPAIEVVDRVGADAVDALDAAVRLDATTRHRIERVPCSLAAHVRDGVPIAEGASWYDRLATEPGVLDRLRFIHDGTAAWRGTGLSGSSAVIVLGTWIGVGMGPHPGVQLTPLAAGFDVR
jgi:hypothetical protein